ncbi:MaoC/PaaZ C-terminal domain-containing protein [Halomicrococcus sp. SG-WS-1]|uniref:MaoC/PaaZ C-terminal domain-containing protein n=1 Tax=Halomicrococcus sp. SG-WS-1 TaxID=3439057 RepID=UPI003F79F530
MFVRYAGASGDFTPIHYDEPFATDVGHPSVFAQGMFSAGVGTRLLREWFGLARLEAYRTRFTARAFPGDSMGVVTVTVWTVDPDGQRTEVAVGRTSYRLFR